MAGGPRVPTLPEVLRRRAETDAERVAFDFEDRSHTFADVHRAAGAWRARLAATGAGPGTRVALMSGNRPEFVYAVYGALQLGAAVVMCSPAWKAAEVRHACAATGPTVAVGDDAGCAALADALPGIATVPFDGPLPSPSDDTADAGDPDADAVLFFSSGTTGLPKAVRHTHRTLGHAVGHWIAALGLTDHDRFQVATPPVHILGLLNIITAVAAGARIRLHPRFDLDACLRAAADERMTLEMAVAPIALGMANHPRLEDFDLSSLRYIMWGATPVAEEVARTVTPPHRGPVAARVRRQRGAGHRGQPGARTRPVASRQRRARGPGRPAPRRRPGDGRRAGGRRDRRDRGGEPVRHGRLPPRHRDGRRVSRRLVPHR